MFFSCSHKKRTKRMRDRSGRSDLCKRFAFTRCSRHVFAQASLCKPRRNTQRGRRLRLIGFAPAGAGGFFGNPSRTGQGPLPHRLFAAACSAALFCTKGQAMRLRLLFRSFSFRKEKEQGLLPFGKGKPSQKNGRIRVRFFFISFRKGGRLHRRVPAGCRHAR